MRDGAPSRLRLTRQQRLRANAEFQRLKQHGQRLTQGCLVANWSELPGGARSRLGVVTARSIGNAVARSRARRLLRQSFREHQHELRVAVDLVLVARRSIAGRKLAEVEHDFLKVLRRARLLKSIE
jgi:ribonuclease P protein component